MKDRTNIKNVLVVAPNWLGDAVLALPAIAGLRELLPSSHITVLGLPHICELFKESPYADDRKIYSSTLLTTVSDIRKERFDLAILFPNSFRTALIVHLARIPLRCGYNRDGRGVMLNLPVRVTEETRNLDQVEYYRNIVSSIEVSQGNDRKSRRESDLSSEQNRNEWLYLSKDELQYANETLHNFNIFPGSMIIGINPGAAYGSAKRWYPERFAKVSSALVNKYKANIIIFGSQQESGIASEIENLSGVPVINMAGKTTIRGLMSLIKQCSVFITNDSGPMHIAAALATPVVAIFGSTDPGKTGPMGDGNVVIRKNADCSPCFMRKCPTDLKCMDLITVDDVIAGVDKILR